MHTYDYTDLYFAIFLRVTETVLTQIQGDAKALKIKDLHGFHGFKKKTNFMVLFNSITTLDIGLNAQLETSNSFGDTEQMLLSGHDFMCLYLVI